MGRSHYHSWLMTQTSGAVAREPHALPEMALPPPQACPPQPLASWLAGVFGPSQDPRKTPARGFAQEGSAALPVPESIGGWWWKSRARAVWVGSWEGWEPGAPQVRHPQADNTRAGVGISSSAHRGDAGLAHVLPQAPCRAGGGGGTLSLSSTRSSSTGLAHPSCLMRQKGLGILLLTLPTAG